jgi:hypothetical protein
MANPFTGRTASLNGPAHDIVPVTPNDGADLPDVAVALYVETAGTLRVTTVSGNTRDLSVADFAIVPVGITRVHATGTSATGIHAYTV